MKRSSATPDPAEALHNDDAVVRGAFGGRGATPAATQRSLKRFASHDPLYPINGSSGRFPSQSGRREASTSGKSGRVSVRDFPRTVISSSPISLTSRRRGSCCARQPCPSPRNTYARSMGRSSAAISARHSLSENRGAGAARLFRVRFVRRAPANGLLSSISSSTRNP
jgi:hypothetical protein